MVQATQKKSSCRVKKEPVVVKSADKNAARTGHVVCVTNVPSTLCASERTVRDFFAEYGMLLSVTIHHNFLDMEPDGFMYLEYAEKTEAEAAVTAVKEKRVGLAAAKNVKFKRAVEPAEITGMKAVLALPRGEPKFQSQQSQNMDEDDLILQSLSQHSFASLPPKRKKKQRKYFDEATNFQKP